MCENGSRFWCILSVGVQAEGETRVKQLQEDVEEIRDIMQENMNRAQERETKLEDLDGRTEELLKHVNMNFSIIRT